MAELAKEEVLARIEGLPEDVQKRIVCALVRHSRIETMCFGYHYCARCGTRVGDTLASAYPGAEQAVIVGHNCEICRTNYAQLDWRDTLLAPDPFPEEVEVGEVANG